MFHVMPRRHKDDQLVYVIGDKQPKGYGLQKTLAGEKLEFSENTSFWPIALIAWILPPGMIWFGVTHLAQGAPANWFNVMSGTIMVVGIIAAFLVLMITGMLVFDEDFDGVASDSYRDIRLFFAKAIKEDRRKIIRMTRSSKGSINCDVPSMKELMGALDTLEVRARVIKTLSEKTDLSKRLKAEIDGYLLSTVEADAAHAEINTAYSRSIHEDISADVRSNKDALDKLNAAFAKYAKQTAENIKQLMEEWDAECRRQLQDSGSNAVVKAIQAAETLETAAEIGAALRPFETIVRGSKTTSL